MKLHPEDGGTVVHRNVSNYSPSGTASHPRRFKPSIYLPAYQHV